MNTEELLSCDVCKELFNSSMRTPRVLKCGHSFCSLCLSSIIQQARRNCPVCQRLILCTSVHEIPVNYNLKQLAENFSGNSTAVLPDQSKGTSRNSTEIEHDVFSQGICSTHNGIQKYYCTTCTGVYLCDECVKKDHKKCQIVPTSVILCEKVKNCNTKITDSLSCSFTEKNKLKKLNDQVLIDLQIYLNLAEEQEKDLKSTKDIIHCLNVDLTKISGLQDKFEAKTHWFTTEKAKNLQEKSLVTAIVREKKLLIELEQLKQLALDAKKCEFSVRKALKAYDNNFKSKRWYYCV